MPCHMISTLPTKDGCARARGFGDGLKKWVPPDPKIIATGNIYRVYTGPNGERRGDPALHHQNGTSKCMTYA